MNAFDFWVVYAVSARKASLVKAGVPASAVVKERVGWSKSYGGRSYPRYRYVASLDYVDAPADDVSEPEPVDPGDPVVSAKATGTEAIAEPTPSTTASAPTRPT